MSRIPTTVTIAPRGKAFQVVRLSQVTTTRDGFMTVEKVGKPTTVRSEADKLRASIDYRLEPTVILVDQVRS